MKLSIVIPIYNVASYLKSCVDSIIDAANVALSVDKDLETEIICVDDASTDGSGKILDDYITLQMPNEYIVMKVVHQTRNGGVSAARNRGLDLLSGEWYLFVDSDDIIRSTLLHDVVSIIRHHDECDLIAFGKTVFPNDGSAPVWVDEDHSGTEEFVEIRTEIPEISARLSACCFAYRSKIFGDVRFPIYDLGEDLVYVAEIIARATSFIYLRKEEYGYRNRSGSAVHAEIGITAMRSIISFHSEVFSVLFSTNKHISSPQWLLRMEQWLVRLPIEIWHHHKDMAWNLLYEEWINSLEIPWRLLDLPMSYRAVIAAAKHHMPLVLIVALCRLNLLLSRYSCKYNAKY